MSTIEEIESAIEQLPTPQVDKLAEWLEKHRAQRDEKVPIDEWLTWACGAGRPDITTDEIMKLTRGEE